MFDIALRAQKDRFIDPLALLVPAELSPTHLTLAAFACGLLSCLFVSFPLSVSSSSSSLQRPLSVVFWLLNRLLDSLDGAVARHRHVASDAGGFLDLLCDFTVYSLLPIAVTYGIPATFEANADVLIVDNADWMVVAVLEASFHLNNFVLFYCAAVAAKLDHNSAPYPSPSSFSPADERRRIRKGKELTSLSMKPALVEGFESGIFFTLMLMMPMYVRWLCWIMAGAVATGIVQRSWDLYGVLHDLKAGKND